MAEWDGQGSEEAFPHLSVALERGVASNKRDASADQRDIASDRRDHMATLRDRAGDVRDQAATQRDGAADLRDEAGDERDRAAELRDVAADRRDQVAGGRDQAAAQRDQAAALFELSLSEGGLRDVLVRLLSAREFAASDRARASDDRRSGVSARTHAGIDRATALADRAAGVRERTRAELDRESAVADRVSSYQERLRAELDRDTALSDRGSSSEDRAFAAFDGLTGVYLRHAGVALLEQEIARARRTDKALVVAFVDVDHLKRVNDELGHAAGDAMLVAVANELKAELRSYDLIIRYGGDEFVCVLSGLSLDDAVTRLALVNIALAEGADPGSVTFGLAELLPEDSARDVVGRADAALYAKRQLRRPT